MKTIITSSFSSMKIYDIVCIGPYACKVGSKIISQIKNPHFKSFMMNNQTAYHQPILNISHKNPYVNTSKLTHFIGKQVQNTVKMIDAQDSIIHLQTGQSIKYKQLIYSGYQKDWKNINYYQNLQQGVKTPHSSVYCDESTQNQQLYFRNTGRIFISIPKIRHFGYQNYFMLHLQDCLKKRAQSKNIKNSTKITVLIQNQKLFPYNQYNDYQLKKMLRQANIQIVTNCQISNLNYKQRKLKINGCITSFQSFYQYLPLKIPQLLKNACINPFEVNQNTLRNSKYSNIHIIGNILPTAHSFYALNYQCNILTINILNSIMGINKLSLYQGESILPLWQKKDSLLYFAMDYYGQKGIFNKIGSNCIVGKFLALQRKLFGKIEIQTYLNSNSCGFPFYFFNKKSKNMQINQQFLPMVLKK